MPTAARHTFKTRDPVDRYSEQLRFYVQLRGQTYHPSMPVPKTTVSDVRQLAKQWSEAFAAALPRFSRGIAGEWRGIMKQWIAAVDRLQDSELKPNDIYDDNLGFWRALRKIASQLGALDQVVTHGDVLVWAVADTVREQVETIEDHAQAVADAGRAAASTAAGIAGAIPTIAKALAVGAAGLGVYAIVKR